MADENGVVKKIHLAVTTATLGLSLLGVAFHAGITEAQLETRLNDIEKHVEYDDSTLARKDVVDQRLLNIEGEEKKIETLQDEQTEELRRLVDRMHGR